MEVQLHNDNIVATDETASIERVTFLNRQLANTQDVVLRFSYPSVEKRPPLYVGITAIDAFIDVVERAEEQCNKSNVDTGHVIWESDDLLLSNRVTYDTPDSELACLICDDPADKAGIVFNEPLNANRGTWFFVHCDCTEPFRRSLQSVYDHSDTLLPSLLD